GSARARLRVCVADGHLGNRDPQHRGFQPADPCQRARLHGAARLRLDRAVPGKIENQGQSTISTGKSWTVPDFQFAVMPLVLISFAKRCASVASNFPASSGVVMKDSKACAPNFSFTSFEFSAFLSARFSRVTTTGGVP